MPPAATSSAVLARVAVLAGPSAAAATASLGSKMARRCMATTPIAAVAATAARLSPARSSPVTLRASFRAAAAAVTRPATHSRIQFACRQTRFQSSAATTATASSSSGSGSGSSGSSGASEETSWFKRFWNSPIGPKTVHFWGPVMKWALALTGLADMARPVEKLSVTQNVALMATGLIWTRWCLIIKPKNYMLAAANLFLGICGVVQVVRIATAGKLVEDLEKEVQEKEEALKAKQG